MQSFQTLDPSDKKEFITYTSFPGEEGNPFDKILRLLDKLNQLPALIYVILLLLINGILTLFNLDTWVALSIFSLLDAMIISLLPFLRISFGKFNSQVFLLSLLRVIFIWFPFPINIIFQCIGTGLVIYGFVYEPSAIDVKTISKKFGNKKNYFTFIHLSDIHLEELGLRELKIKRIIEKKSPDFIIYSGDFLNLSNNQDSKSINQVIEFFNLLHSIAPVYYVTGSPAVDVDESINLIENQISAKRLNNSNQIIRLKEISINLIGITCTHKPHIDIKKLPHLIDSQTINFLIYHSPDLIYEIKKDHDIKLMFSGHTHGGQVRFPILGALFTGSLYGRKLQCGLYKIHDTLLYISRGIGLEGLGAPRVRFLCKPEIIEWKIEV